MVSRSDLRAALREEMIEATEGTVDPHDIRLVESDDSENIPSVVYADNYTRLVYNGVGTAPAEEVRNEDGVVTQQIWRQYLEGRFDVQIRAASGSVSSELYDALHHRFQRYHFGGWDRHDVHPHITGMWVGNVNGAPDGSTFPVFRGDVVEVFVTFYQDYVKDVPPIEEIRTEFDINFSYNTGDPSGPVIVTK